MSHFEREFFSIEEKELNSQGYDSELRKLYLEFAGLTKDKVRVYLKYDKGLTEIEKKFKIKKIELLIRAIKKANELSKQEAGKVTMSVLAKSLQIKDTALLYKAFRDLEIDYQDWKIYGGTKSLNPKVEEAFVKKRLEEIKIAVLILKENEEKVTALNVAQKIGISKSALNNFFRKRGIVFKDIAFNSNEGSQFELLEKLEFIENVDKVIDQLDKECLAISVVNVIKEMGISISTFKRRVKKNNLSYGDLGICTEGSCYEQQKERENVLERIDQIGEAVNEIIENGEKLTRKNVAQKIGIEGPPLSSWLKRRELDLWDVGACPYTEEEEILRIIELVDQAVEDTIINREYLAISSISKKIGMSRAFLESWLKRQDLDPWEVGICLDYNDEEIKRKREEVRLERIKKNTLLNRIGKIESVLEEVEEEGAKMTLGIMADKLGIKLDSLRKWLKYNGLEFGDIGICPE